MCCVPLKLNIQMCDNCVSLDSFLHIMPDEVLIVLKLWSKESKRPSISRGPFDLKAPELWICKMPIYNVYIGLVIITLISSFQSVAGYYLKQLECGPYGFNCEPNNKVRLCEGDNLLGPAFICPPNTLCNEDSSNVCENAINYIDSSITRAIRCHRNERIADPNVPGCKGYILCIPNKNRFQGIKFKCSGTTIFNGYSRTCSSPENYRCPLSNTTKTTSELYGSENRRIDSDHREHSQNKKTKPLECKNYKFSVTQESTPVRATYFCPSRPVPGEASVRCTIFSNQFCVTLERDDYDQFVQINGAAYRKPRN